MQNCSEKCRGQFCVPTMMQQYPENTDHSAFAEEKTQPTVNRITENCVNEVKMRRLISSEMSICAWYVPFKGLFLQKKNQNSVIS